LASLELGQSEAVREYCEAARLEGRSPQLLETIAAELSRLGHPAEAAVARDKAHALREGAKPG